MIKNLLYFLMLAAFSAEAYEPKEIVTYKVGPVVKTTFECNTASTGKCNYLIANSLCNEIILPSGQKKKTCRYHQIYKFTLKSGDKKIVANLPGDFLYCMKSESIPDLPTCIATPIPH